MLQVLKYFAWGTLVLANFVAIAASSTTLGEIDCYLKFSGNQEIVKKCERGVRTAAKWSAFLIMASGIGSAITLGFMYCVLQSLKDIREQLAKS